MGDEPTVLVLTSPYDATADYVVDELNHRGRPVFRCNPGDFPARLSLVVRTGHGWTGSLRLPESRLDLDRIGCAYYRRPTLFEFPDQLTDTERRWALQEARAGLGGVLATLPRWLNHPADISRAEYKAVQLAHAQAAGLTVPPTLITNDPAEARLFAKEVGQAIYKPLTSTTISEEGTHKIVYANRIVSDDIDDTVSGTAHLIQAWVPKAYEVRVTVVDDRCFGVRIDAGSEAGHVDWRTDYASLTYTPVQVPAPVEGGVRRLMSGLGLRFAALDFVVTPGAAWTFLELNPNGQWAWLQDVTGLPIAAAIADALTKDSWPRVLDERSRT